MPSLWRQELESWLSTIEVSGSVLDVGGAQKPVKGRTKTWDVDRYKIADRGSGNGAVDFDLDDEREWDRGAVFDTYENVFCLETIMYTKNPVRSLDNLTWLTEKHLYISNPLEGYGPTKPAGTDMSRLLEPWWEYWLKEYGMKIEEMTVVEPKWQDGFGKAQRDNGYKMIRPYASGTLIHAVK